MDDMIVVFLEVCCVFQHIHMNPANHVAQLACNLLWTHYICTVCNYELEQKRLINVKY